MRFINIKQNGMEAISRILHSPEESGINRPKSSIQHSTSVNLY